MDRFACRLALAGVLLGLSGLACGGGGGGGTAGGGGANAFALVYTDPPAGGYRFVRDPQLSTSTHLVLDLVGPGTDQGRGVAFGLALGPGTVAWGKVAAGDTQYAQNVLFNLGTGTPLLESAVQSQATLLVDDFQKGAGSGLAMAGPLCRVALDAQASLAATASVPIQVVQFQFLPATGRTLVDATGSCAVGTLAIQ